MTPHRHGSVLCVLVTALLAAGCGGIVDPSKNVIEEITGTLQPFSLNVHEFSVSKNGEFEVRITRLEPNADAFLSLAYGPTPCNSSAYQTNQFAQLNRLGLAGPINSGRFCLYVADIGTLSQPANYTLRVSRP